jgi:hypothetical protein
LVRPLNGLLVAFFLDTHHQEMPAAADGEHERCRKPPGIRSEKGQPDGGSRASPDAQPAEPGTS